jgi:hypothetical protein
MCEHRPRSRRDPRDRLHSHGRNEVSIAEIETLRIMRRLSMVVRDE